MPLKLSREKRNPNAINSWSENADTVVENVNTDLNSSSWIEHNP